jgi:hypothetical protein
MKLKLSSFCLYVLLMASGVLVATTVRARPNPDQVGVCYVFQDDTQVQMEPCVILAGYGAGAWYVVLNWSNRSQTTINMINFCPEGNYDERSFCGYTVDEQDAEPYFRDVFLQITTIKDPDNMDCYRVGTTTNSICYRFNN